VTDTSIAQHDYSDQIIVVVEAERPQHTRYAGALAYQRAWDRFGVDRLLAEAGIHYGRERDQAPDMSLALSLGPLVGANSIRKVAQRFGGEEDELERDELLVNMIDEPFSQRTLDRFATHPRHDWEGLNWRRVEHLQRQPGFEMMAKGVIILDDFPLPKPHAREMEYLTPIWDNSLKREVMGYLIVHLYYYHPKRFSYSLYMEPWLKTSATGETVSKGDARRRARPGEERSRLDIGLEAVEEVLQRNLPFQALIIDSWYTVRWLGHELTQRGVAWVGEADSKRKFQIGHRVLSVPEIWERYGGRLKRVKGLKKRVRAYAIQAVIPPDRYTKVPQPVVLVLVEGLHRPRRKDDGRHLLVCNQPTWTAKRIIRLFSYRPKIEPSHRDGKQDEGWLEFHTRKLTGLRCHLALALIRDTLLRLMRAWEPQLAGYSLAQMIEHWIGYVADLTRDPMGRLRVHIDQDHPALSLICGPGPPRSCTAL
jgi:hypothetical protein